MARKRKDDDSGDEPSSDDDGFLEQVASPKRRKSAPTKPMTDPPTPDEESDIVDDSADEESSDDADDASDFASDEDGAASKSKKKATTTASPSRKAPAATAAAKGGAKKAAAPRAKKEPAPKKAAAASAKSAPAPATASASSAASSRAVSSASSVSSAKEPKEIVAKDAFKTQKECETAMLQFLNSQNRPYSALMIFDSFKGKIKKLMGQKALDALADRKQIAAKEFGKAKIYLADQRQFPVPDPEALRSMTIEVESLTAELRATVQEGRDLAARLKALDGEMSVAQLRAGITAQTAENGRLREKFTWLRENGVEIDESALQEKRGRLARFQVECRKRKALCRNILDQMSEGMQKKPSELAEELGLEL